MKPTLLAAATAQIHLPPAPTLKTPKSSAITTLKVGFAITTLKVGFAITTLKVGFAITTLKVGFLKECLCV
jgi:hypothetical protein